jgi:hypothetical protein
MSRCIVNLATHVGANDTYVRAQERLLASAARFNVPMLYWTDAFPIGSPTHADVPYAFKVFAFDAAQQAGATSILWCDANVWAQRDPAPVFELMERQGHVFFRNWFNCGQWCTDAALAKHRLTRDEAERIPDITACCMGLDLTHERSRASVAQRGNGWRELHRRVDERARPMLARQALPRTPARSGDRKHPRTSAGDGTDAVAAAVLVSRL